MDLAILSPNSPVREYIHWIDSCANQADFDTKYRHVVSAEASAEKCFLTVIIRTQGRRMEMLQDVLLCLQAQGDQDFEVVIICHKAEPAAQELVREMLSNQAAAFRKKTRLYCLDEGERGAPINLGFAYAHGDYAVCLDDDDLVFDNWVEVFHQAQKEHDGMILRSYVLTQPWHMAYDAEGRQIITAAGTPDAHYCESFQVLRQMSESMCPFMGVAFPLFLFRELHILFDETISTMEDWDYILRTEGIAGLYDTKETVAIYRLWDSKDVSHGVADDLEWSRNYRQIATRVKNTPLLLSAEEFGRSKVELIGLQTSDQKGRSCFLKEATMFWSYGEPFSDDQHLKTPMVIRDDKMIALFDLNKTGQFGPYRRIRIDPGLETMFSMKDVHFKFFRQGKILEEYGLEDVVDTSGLVFDDQIVFLDAPPRMEFNPLKQNKYDQVEFSAQILYHCPPTLLQWTRNLCADAHWVGEHRNMAHIYLDLGNGYSDAAMMEVAPAFIDHHYHTAFDLATYRGSRIHSIRFDPTESGMIFISGFQAELSYASGKLAQVDPTDFLEFNGFATGDGIAFIAGDPIILFSVEEKDTLLKLTVSGEIHFVDSGTMEMLFAKATYVPNYQMICQQLNQMQVQ